MACHTRECCGTADKLISYKQTGKVAHTEKSMYCKDCNCEYSGWSGKCPRCKQPLEEGVSSEHIRTNGHIEYDQLVEMIQRNGGSIDVVLEASQVSRKKSRRFPWLGFGYAWTQIMHGEGDDIRMDFITTEVEKDRTWTFPYRGHGYAWQQVMQGWIAGNECTVSATDVSRKRSWTFPYSGYGYAWTEKLEGDCGDEIRVSMKASKVSKSRKWVFPYFGFGYAWVDAYQVSLTLV
jgi:hypothetical protein